MNKTKTKNTNIVEPIRNKVDIQRIIDYFRANNKEKYAVLFTLGVNSGLRVSDLLGFKVKDVFDGRCNELAAAVEALYTQKKRK